MVYSFGKLNNASFKSFLRHVTTVPSIFDLVVQLNGEATEYSDYSVSNLVTPLFRFYFNWCLI